MLCSQAEVFSVAWRGTSIKVIHTSFLYGGILNFTWRRTSCVRTLKILPLSGFFISPVKFIAVVDAQGFGKRETPMDNGCIFLTKSNHWVHKADAWVSFSKNFLHYGRTANCWTSHHHILEFAVTNIIPLIFYFASRPPWSMVSLRRSALPGMLFCLIAVVTLVNLYFLQIAAYYSLSASEMVLKKKKNIHCSVTTGMLFLDNSVIKFHGHCASYLRPMYWVKQSSTNTQFDKIFIKINNYNLQINQAFAAAKLGLITSCKENTGKYILHIILTNSLYPSERNYKIYKAVAM